MGVRLKVGLLTLGLVAGCSGCVETLPRKDLRNLMADALEEAFFVVGCEQKLVREGKAATLEEARKACVKLYDKGMNTPVTPTPETLPTL